MLRVGIIVNSPGLQERRAHHLAAGASGCDVRWVEVSPAPHTLARRCRDIDVLYVIDAGKAGFAAFVTAKLMGTPCIVEIGDPQARLYRSQGRSPLSVALGFAIDRAVAWFADGIVVRGRQLAEESPLRGPWMHLPDGVDLEQFSPSGGSTVRADLGVRAECFLVGVVGSITWSPLRRWCYGMEIVEALPALPTVVEALVVGGGTGLDRLRSRAEELGVSDRLHTVGRIDHASVPAYITAMDICVSTQTDDAVGRGRTTAKLPEYLACDRYVLASRVGEAARILPEEMLVSYDGAFDGAYPKRLAQQVERLLPDVAALRRGAGTRRIAEERFDYTALARAWGAFLDRVVVG